MHFLFVLFFLLCFPFSGWSVELAELKDFQVDLKNPLFKEGVLITEHGGVISSDGMRIQAQKIRYVNRIENGVAIRKIEAEGDLLFQYGEQIFVGSKLDFDLNSKTGVIEEGKTEIDVWFVGGEKIYLREDGSYYILNAYITTWASDEPLWEVHAGKIQITEDKMLSARNLYFRIAKIPFFWLPSFKANLNFKKPPIRYKVHWDKKLGPKISARYLVYSVENFALFLRGDYRLGKGGALALETEYLSEDLATEFVTKNYGAIDDKSTPIQKKPDHYRLQGLFRTASNDQKTKVHLVYDKISDQAMIGEFTSDDFEINTEDRTHLLISHREEMGFLDFQFEPRINPWQSTNQRLPSLAIALRPLELGHSGIFFHNYGSAAYLDYVYADNLRAYIQDIHSARLETINSIYRPCSVGPFTLTPEVGFVAIFYDNGPQKRSVGQFIGSYGADLKTSIRAQFTKWEHALQPYLVFRGLTPPTASENSVFIFNLDDGYHQLNTLKVGCANDFYSMHSLDRPLTLGCDLYTYLFFGGRGDLAFFPRLYADFSLHHTRNETLFTFIWNQQEGLVDRVNLKTSWTVSDDLAFVFEMRHRSRYDWRKADHENFILDTARPFNDLLRSPISDGRNTLLLKAEARIHPLWTMHIGAHAGWGRSHEPSYHSAKIDLYTTILTGWRIRLSAAVTADDTSFDAGIELLRH